MDNGKCETPYFIVIFSQYWESAREIDLMWVLSYLSCCVSGYQPLNQISFSLYIVKLCTSHLYLIFSIFYLSIYLFSSLTLIKYALLMIPLARSIEELLPDQVSNSLWCFILLRAALVFSNVAVAFALPFFGKFWNFLSMF